MSTTTDLIQVAEIAAYEAGFLIPVALTPSAHADCVAWTDADAVRTGAIQEPEGRLTDVLHMAALAVRRARRSGPARLPFRVCRVAVDARPGEDGDIEPDEVTLVLTLHEEKKHGLHATISLPTEKIPA